MTKTTRPITQFFMRVKPNAGDSASLSQADQEPPLKVARHDDTVEYISEAENIASNLNVPLLDISTFSRNRKTLTDDEKYKCLTEVWIPSSNFDFPTSQKRNLKFQYTWLTLYPWLTYSQADDGAFCKYCVLFAQQSGSQIQHGFTEVPFQDWIKAKAKFKHHQDTNYHQRAMIDGQNFKLIYENKKNDIVTELDSAKKIQAAENRSKLAPIIRALLFCAIQGIALRGHKDSGPLSQLQPESNDGNFRALLRYGMECGDEKLKEHLTNAAGNAQYLSPTIQNEILDIAADIVRSKIVKKINEAECFTVIADETTDIAGIEQFSICARYVHFEEGKYVLREDFLGFAPLTITTGEELAKTLLNSLKDFGIDTRYLKGQGYDGANSMSGEFNGCSAWVKKIHPEAVYMHCASHSLNLALCHSCKLQAIRNTLGTLKETIAYFRRSTKAGGVLKDIIQKSCEGLKQTRLIKFCETRWVEHLASLSLFYDVYEYICMALEKLDKENTKFDGVQPHALLASITSPQFILSLTVLKSIFSLTKPVSTYIQTKECDLQNCVVYTDQLKQEVLQMRTNAEKDFKTLFEQATEMASKVNTQIECPRRVEKQKNRENHSGDPETYYRRSLYIPFLDYFLDQLEVRFLKHRELLEKVQNILPYKCANLDDDELSETVKVLEKQYPSENTDTFLSELKMWRRFQKEVPEEDRENTFIGALNKCEKALYPTVHRFLQLAATLPVTVATSERSFSSLRRLKTYLRNTTGEDRLNSLAILNIHHEIKVEIEEVLDVFANRQKRRINL